MSQSSTRSYSLVIPLPFSIQTTLHSKFYGLPQVQWREAENLHLVLREFKGIEGSILNEIRLNLSNICFIPFTIVLSGIIVSKHKKEGRIIQTTVADNLHLNLLKKEIEREVRLMNLSFKGEKLDPHVLLGNFTKENPQKLSDFLMTHADYTSLPISVTSLALVSSFQTPKRHIIEIIENYPAFKKANEED